MGKLRNRLQEGPDGTPKSKQKKSVRLMMQNYKNSLDKKAKNKFTWPRTVEAAVDPFLDFSGKNKMFFVIACNLFPESKIVQPSDSESDDDEEQDITQGALSEVDNEDPAIPDISGSSSKDLQKRSRRCPSAQQTGRSEANGSWQNRYNSRRPIQKRSSTRPHRDRIIDQDLMLEVINTVVKRYSENMNEGISVEPHLNPPPTVQMINYLPPSTIPTTNEPDEDDVSDDGDEMDGEESEEGIDAENAQNEVQSVSSLTSSDDDPSIDEDDEDDHLNNNIEKTVLSIENLLVNLSK